MAKKQAQIEIRVEEQPEAKLTTTAAAEVILPKKITGFAQTITEVLERAAGIHLSSYGGLDDFSAISIRGSTSDQVLIYLDGVLLNSAQGQTVDLSFIPLDNVDRIEIYRGGSPGKMVDSTPGGVIAIYTKGKPEKTENLLRNSLGSYYTYRGHLQRTEALNNFYYLGSFDYFRSRGNFPYVADQGTRNNTSDDQTIDRANNNFAAYDFTGIAGNENKTDLNWKMFENFFYKEEGVAGLGSQIVTDTSLKTIKNFLHGKLGDPHSPSSFKWEGDLFFDYLKSRFQDPKGEIGLGVQNNNDTTIRLGPEFHWNTLLAQNQILNGFLAYRTENFWPTNYAANPASGPMSQRQMVGVGLEDEIGLFGEKLALDPSLRFQTFFNSLSGSDPSITPAVPNNNSINNELSGKLGIKWSPLYFVTLKGNVYRGFRQPTFGELFGDRGNIVGNPSLVPEKGLNFDLGAATRGSDVGFINTFHLEATTFRQMTDNLIQFVQTSQFTIRAQNATRALIWGVEVAASMRLFEQFKWSGNYVYQIAKDDSDRSPTRGNFLPGRPKHQIYAEAEYQYRYFTPFVQLNFLSDNFLDSQNLLKVNHRTLLAAGFKTNPLKWMQFLFTTKNLLNERVADIAGFPLPGRSYWGELELKL